VVDFTQFVTDIRVMAPLAGEMHRGIVVATPDDHPRREGLVCVEFTPPVKAGEPFTEITHITCEVECLELGWQDE
jgi:hypothetical protein